MNINNTQENEEKGKFEIVLYELSELIRNGKQGNPQLNSIVEDGLKIARKTDNFYEEYGKISKSRLYFLYKVIFELWSYQHHNILENITNNKRNKGKNSNYEDLLYQHKDLWFHIIYDFDELEKISDEQELIEQTLLRWKNNIDELIKFFNEPLVAYVAERTLKSSSLSAQTKYIIFITVLFVMGVIIATLILIHG